MKGGTTYRILSDQVGSVRLVVNADTGAIAQRIDYDAWGNPTYVTGPPDFQPFGFAGGLSDLDTGLVRFGARDYDPRVGRWTSKDQLDLRTHAYRTLHIGTAGPYGPAAMESNAYGYVVNEPIGLIDPSGAYGIGGAVGGAALNFAGQLGANLLLTGGDLSLAIACINYTDVLISAAVGALAPTLLANVVRGKPGPFGLSRRANTLLWMGGAVPGGFAAKRMAPDTPLGGDDCMCRGLGSSGLVSELTHAL